MVRSLPLIIGHRGAPAWYPEHTAAGYRHAIEAGADLVEPDVVPTADGVLLVRHEPRLDDTTDIAEHAEFAARRRSGPNGGWYATDFTWAELQQLRAVERWPELRPDSHAHSGTGRLLRLRDLVQLVDARAAARGRWCGLVIELKWHGWMHRAGFRYERLLERELEPVLDAPCLRDVRIESFESSVLDRLATVPWLGELGARRIVLVDDEPLLRPGEEGPEWCTDEGLDDAGDRYDGIAVRDTLLSDDLVERAHARGLEVFGFTLRSEDQFLPAEYAGRPSDYWRALADTGVDGLFADDPAAVRASLSES